MSAVNLFVPNDYYITKLQGAEKTHTSANPFSHMWKKLS